MNLEELTEAEQTVLGRMVRLVVMVDGRTSNEERERLHELAVDLGEELFWKVIEENKGKSLSFKECLAAVTRQPARELIYGVLLAIAFVGTIDQAERNALDAVAKEWEVEEELVEEPEADEADQADQS